MDSTRQIKTSIELHDSYLGSYVMQNGALIFDLCPAYLHKWEKENGTWVGTGWHQNASIKIENVKELHKKPTLPVEISDGRLSVEDTIFNDLIPVPLNMSGPSLLTLYLFGGMVLEISGSSVSIQLQGEAKFVENLPDDMAPE